jgi:GUN4-like
LLPLPKSQGILQELALAMSEENRLTISREGLLKYLAQHPVLQAEEVEATEWLRKIVEVSELLVEREPREYEFPHISFQGYFTAAQLAKAKNTQDIQNNARLVLQHWNVAVWRETVLLYTAQLAPKMLDPVIRKACELGSSAAELALICLKEYPRPEKLSPELAAMLQNLRTIVVDSRYQQLERLLQQQRWKEADYETYRLMITAVGKEEGEYFTREELLNFSGEHLWAIDGLWVKYSNGRFGFSVQKRIYAECGGELDGSNPSKEVWEAFGDRIGWRTGGVWNDYDELIANLSLSSPIGIFPCGGRGWWSIRQWGLLLGGASLLSNRDL